MVDCDKILKELAEKENWTKEQEQEFLRQAELIKKQRDATARIEPGADVAEQLAQKWAEREKLAAWQRKLNTARNLRAQASLVNYCLTHYAGKEGEGLYARMVGSKYLREGGRDSVDARGRALAGHFLGGMINDLKQLGEAHFRIFEKNKDGRAIAGAMWLVETPEKFKGPKEIMEIAQVIHKWEEQARMSANAAGAWIGKLPGYIVRQSHDAAKIRRAGYQAWRDFIEPRLDWAKISDGRYLDPAEAGAKEHFLKATWDALATGIHLAEHSAKANALVKPSIMGSEAARMSKGRILHFLSGEDWFDYNAMFGRRGGLNEAILHGLQSSAESTALMQVFGPGPQATFDAVKAALKRTLIERGDTDGAARIKDIESRLDDAMKELDGTLNIEGNITAAEWGRNIRAWQSMCKLGGAVITSIADLPNFMAELAYQGRNPFGAIADGLKYFVQGRGSVESQRILALCSVFSDGMLGSVAARFSTSDLPGSMTAAQNWFFKWNGLTWWTDSWKRAALLTMAHDMALEKGLAWGQLSKQRQRVLSQYGIDAARWDLIRKGANSFADGREYLTPEAITNLADNEFEAYLKSQGRDVTKGAVKRLKDELEQQLRTYYRDRVQYAVMEPDAKNRRFMRRGQSSGTAMGEAIRFMGQFKSFPLLMIQRSLAREIYGRGADTFGAGLGQVFKQSAGGDTNNLFQLICGMTVMGYVAMTTKQLLAGKTPNDITEHPIATLSAAFVQGGGAGIFGDFLLGMRNRMGGTLLNTLAGPTAGSLDKLTDVLMKIRDGDIDVAPELVRNLWGMVPGNNLFYVKGAMDYLVLYQFYEMMRPGYLKRMKDRMEKETGQKFLWDPERATTVAKVLGR